MAFKGQFTYGIPVTAINIVDALPDNAVIPATVVNSLKGDVLGITVADLFASASVITFNGTTLYSTTPLAGPLVGPVSDVGNIAFGDKAGKNTQTNNSTFLGIESGAFATNASNSIFIGYHSGRTATNARNSVFLGIDAGKTATDAGWSNFIGQNAGSGATAANHSNFLGYLAGVNATGADNSNFLGQWAGYFASTAFRSNFLGYEAGMNSTGNNVNAFGYRAHKGGSLSGQTVFANATLPSYLNRTAAVAAITVPLGAVAGNTYLYYNETIFAIQGIRL